MPSNRHRVTPPSAAVTITQDRLSRRSCTTARQLGHHRQTIGRFTRVSPPIPARTPASNDVGHHRPTIGQFPPSSGRRQGTHAEATRGPEIAAEIATAIRRRFPRHLTGDTSPTLSLNTPQRGLALAVGGVVRARPPRRGVDRGQPPRVGEPVRRSVPQGAALARPMERHDGATDPPTSGGGVNTVVGDCRRRPFAPAGRPPGRGCGIA